MSTPDNTHPAPSTAAVQAEAPKWPNVEIAMEDPIFQQARAIMGTENWFQDNALRNVINYVLGIPESLRSENVALTTPDAQEAEPMRAHVEGFAMRSGWESNSGEGAFEFVQRKCYHQGWQDGRREALGDAHRDLPEVAQPPALPAAPTVQASARALASPRAEAVPQTGELVSLRREIARENEYHRTGKMPPPSSAEEYFSGKSGRAEDVRDRFIAELFTALAQADHPAAVKEAEPNDDIAALLDGFDSRIATAEANQDSYDVGYMKAMKAKFEKLVAALSSTPATVPLTEGQKKNCIYKHTNVVAPYLLEMIDTAIVKFCEVNGIATPNPPTAQAESRIEQRQRAPDRFANATPSERVQLPTAQPEAGVQGGQTEPQNMRERWNIERDGKDLLVCFNDHDKGEKCEYQRFVRHAPQPERVALTPLTNGQIVRIGETLGEQVPGVSDYTSWPGLGYRLDDNGEHKIPRVPDVAVEFAQAVIVKFCEVNGIGSTPGTAQP